jgi:hypothetical protein
MREGAPCALERGHPVASKDEKIFVYLRLRDDKETLLKSKIREFTGIGKLLVEFLKDVLEQFGLQILKLGSLEYVESNTDLVLVSFKKDVIRQKLIISGLIPKDYQARMLDSEETRLKISTEEFLEKISENLDPASRDTIEQKLRRPAFAIRSMIRDSINENGEFYIALDSLEYS